MYKVRTIIYFSMLRTRDKRLHVQFYIEDEFVKGFFHSTSSEPKAQIDIGFLISG